MKKKQSRRKDSTLFFRHCVELSTWPYRRVSKSVQITGTFISSLIYPRDGLSGKDRSSFLVVGESRRFKDEPSLLSLHFAKFVEIRLCNIDLGIGGLYPLKRRQPDLRESGILLDAAQRNGGSSGRRRATGQREAMTPRANNVSKERSQGSTRERRARRRVGAYFETPSRGSMQQVANATRHITHGIKARDEQKSFRKLSYKAGSYRTDYFIYY